jgi:carbamoyltransferase
MAIKYILGIQSIASHDTGASIVKLDTTDNSIKYVCISEERLIRKKYPYTFPIHSIDYCMEYFKIKNLNRIDLLISDWNKVKKWQRSGPSYNYSMFDYVKEKFKFDEKKIIQINHHLAHAASTYYTSNFKESAILIVDGQGSDLETTTYYHGVKNKITKIENYREYGIGSAYSAVTSRILNLGTGGEGKTMGLAPYGEKHKGKIKIKFKLDGIKTDFSQFMKRQPFQDVLNQIDKKYISNPIKEKHKLCKNKNHLNPYFSGIAYDIQNASEKIMVHLGKDIQKKIKSENLCLAGGVALNSVANKKLYDAANFKKMFVFPACSDAGIPFGLALWGAVNKYCKNKKFKINFDNAYTGKNYSNLEINNLLKKFKIKSKKSKDDEVASLLSKGKIFGRLSEASEYGPRALGNRSILADPRNVKMRDYINKKVKHREVFRPFAPSILEDEYNKHFDLKTISPYMLLVAKSKKPNIIPSAIHIDGTARVQTVNKIHNKRFYNLIKAFHKITKVPILLNTSFNDAGEPLVETPLDALLCFLKTKIDYLIIEDKLIYRPKNSKTIIKKLETFRNKLINNREKLLLKRFMKSFSHQEFLIRRKNENNLAIYEAIYKPSKIFCNILEKNKNKKILLVGTNDHTAALIKTHKNKLQNRAIDYFELPFNDFLKSKNKIEFLNSVTKINNNYDVIIISSFEYIDRIKKIINPHYSNKQILSIYNNRSRSIVDTHLINKNKDKKYIYKNGIYQKL